YLGDFSLFISGFFQDSLSRKLVDVDYYISMGEGAYQQLSSLRAFRKQQELFSMIFSELASRFVQWVDVITAVREVSHIHSKPCLLRLSENLLRGGGDRTRDLLSQHGIFPNRDGSSRYSH